MEFKTLRAEYDGVPRALTRADRPQNASSSRVYLQRQNQRHQNQSPVPLQPHIKSNSPSTALTRSGSSASARPWVPPSRSPSDAHSFRLDAQAQLDLDGNPLPIGGLSLAEEREQSRRYRTEQAAVRPLMTECENRVEQCTAHMQSLIAELRTGMVCWSALASAVTRELTRVSSARGAPLADTAFVNAAVSIPPPPTPPRTESVIVPTALPPTPSHAVFNAHAVVSSAVDARAEYAARSHVNADDDADSYDDNDDDDEDDEDLDNYDMLSDDDDDEYEDEQENASYASQVLVVRAPIKSTGVSLREER